MHPFAKSPSDRVCNFTFSHDNYGSQVGPQLLKTFDYLTAPVRAANDSLPEGIKSLTEQKLSIVPTFTGGPTLCRVEN